MEARGRPALVPGESPASVITSSPILSNSGRTPLVLLVLHLLSRAHLAPPAFRPLSSSATIFFSRSPSAPFPPATPLLSFEFAVSSSFSLFLLRAQQFLIRSYFTISFTYFFYIYIYFFCFKSLLSQKIIRFLENE